MNSPQLAQIERMKSVDKICNKQVVAVKRSIAYEDSDNDVTDASRELKRMCIVDDSPTG